jgi:hypothetical protein
MYLYDQPFVTNQKYIVAYSAFSIEIHLSVPRPWGAILKICVTLPFEQGYCLIKVNILEYQHQIAIFVSLCRHRPIWYRPVQPIVHQL